MSDYKDSVKRPNSGAGVCNLIFSGVFAYFFSVYADPESSPDGNTICFCEENTRNVYDSQ